MSMSPRVAPTELPQLNLREPLQLRRGMMKKRMRPVLLRWAKNLSASRAS